MAEKLKNLINEIALDYIILRMSVGNTKEQKHTMPGCDYIGDFLFTKKTVDFISQRDSSFLERIEQNKANLDFNENGLEEIMHQYGTIMFYDLFEEALQKKDRTYFASVKKEILEQGGNAEIDVDYLERLMPSMKSLNVMFGMYNREYTMEDKEEISFGYSIRTGRQKPKVVLEKDFIIPYNLRKNN